MILNGVKNEHSFIKNHNHHFKSILAKKNKDYIKEIDKEAYSKWICDFCSLYEEVFPKSETRIKQKTSLLPWITKGIMKSFKQKQKPNNKFLKSRIKENDGNYKDYKTLTEKIRKK